MDVSHLWCRVSEKLAARRENAQLRARIAELEQRPLVAVVECQECAQLRRQVAELQAQPAGPTNGRYPCPHCTKTFFSEQVRDDHTRRVHAQKEVEPSNRS